MLVEQDRVTDDGADCRRGDDIRIETILLHGLFLFHCRTVGHIHRLSQRPFDVVIIGRQIKKVLVEELDVSLGFHHEVCFLLASLCQERDVAVEDVDLVALVGHQLCTIEYCEAADDCAPDHRHEDGEQGQPCFLFQTLYQHNTLFFHVSDGMCHDGTSRDGT